RVGDLAEQLRVLHRRGVDAHLVGPGAQQPPGVVDRTDAAADGQRDEHLLGRAAHDVVDRVALLAGGGDVEEHELVGTLGVVRAGQLHRVAGVAQLDEADALHHPAGVDVQAGDHPGGWRAADRHGASSFAAVAAATAPSASARLNRPAYS